MKILSLSLLEFIRYSLLVESVQSSVAKFKKDNPAIAVALPGNIEEIITNIDPTGATGECSKWLLSKLRDNVLANPLYIEEPTSLDSQQFYQDDFPKIKPFLKKWYDLKHPKFKAYREEHHLSMDLNSFKTTEALMAAVADLSTEGFKTNKEAKAVFKAAEGEGKELIVETDKYNVYKVTSPSIAMKIGALTWTIGSKINGWCTQSAGQAINHLSSGPLYIFETKDGMPAIQLHTPTNQFKDVDDKEIYTYTPDLMKAFKDLSAQDDGILLWCHDRGIKGYEDIDPVTYATKSPEGAYGYLTSSKHQSKPTKQINEMLLSGPNGTHLGGYYIMQAACGSHGQTPRQHYSDMLNDKLIGFPSESAFVHRVKSARDAGLAGRIAVAFSDSAQEEFLKFAKEKRNPVALVNIATKATKRRLDRDSELMIMQLEDNETWKEYASHFRIKITEKEAEDAINDSLSEKDISSYINVLPLEQIEKIFKNAGSVIMTYLKSHKEFYDKLITTNPDWAYCYCIDVLDKL